MTPEQRARAVAEAMWAQDSASKWAGIELVEIGEATAVMALTVAARHCNGHGICHGGVTYMLADSAFAYACNSRNQSTLAQHNSITYTAPGRLGDRLTATASEVALNGRSGIYDVAVTNQDGTTVARLRGLSRAVKGRYVDESEGEEAAE